MRVFIIGPGGVGKSTAGAILAKKISHEFIDLDQEFCKRIQNIGVFIKNKGYRRYCHQNSELFYSILEEVSRGFVLVLSSGFLVHEGLGSLTKKHKKTLEGRGISILLLPSDSLGEGRKIIVARQLLRGFGLHKEREAEKYTNRFHVYKNLRDIKIFSHEEPKKIAEQMKQQLLLFQKK